MATLQSPSGSPLILPCASVLPVCGAGVLLTFSTELLENLFGWLCMKKKTVINWAAVIQSPGPLAEDPTFTLQSSGNQLSPQHTGSHRHQNRALEAASNGTEPQNMPASAICSW